jgi:hypothetical protein
MTGADVTIDYGVGKPKWCSAECKVNQFRITPMEGGSVIVFMRVQCKPTTEKQIAKLYTLQETGVTLIARPGRASEAEGRGVTASPRLARARVRQRKADARPPP